MIRNRDVCQETEIQSPHSRIIQFDTLTLIKSAIVNIVEGVGQKRKYRIFHQSTDLLRARVRDEGKVGIKEKRERVRVCGQQEEASTLN